MNLSEETIQRAVIETLLERLPNCLAEESQEPIRYLHRDNFGPMSWRDELIQLPPLAELWAEQHIALNYPALLVHYRETTETEIAECDEKDVALLFQLDLILTYHEPEALQFLWLRYANAVKRAVRSINFPVQVQTPGQRITESGPLESIYLRRGLIDLQITY
jgi:hypothetical protein